MSVLTKYVMCGIAVVFFIFAAASHEYTSQLLLLGLAFYLPALVAQIFEK